MRTVELSEAARRLPELIESASRGDLILVTSGGEPKAQIVALAPDNKRLRQPGKGKGRFIILPGFDEPAFESFPAKASKGRA